MLAHVFPAADVPVVQLSINALQPLDYHLDIGARLAPLREHGVLIVGSGNVVHNLRRIDWATPTKASTGRIDSTTPRTELMLESPGDILKLAEHDDFARAVPTPDHFIPLLYIAAVWPRRRTRRPTCSSMATRTDRCR